MNSKKEKIILTQIKQDFTTPVGTISDYINLIIDGSDIYNDEISEEFENIKKSAKTLRVNFNEAFLEFAETKEKKLIVMKKLRSYVAISEPLNGIIGCSEILIEDYEDDIDENIMGSLTYH